VQTGGVLSAIAAGKGIDLGQKKRHAAQSFTFHSSFIHFLAIILQINHLVE